MHVAGAADLMGLIAGGDNSIPGQCPRIGTTLQAPIGGERVEHWVEPQEKGLADIVLGATGIRRCDGSS
jgi:hypothetical protein